MGWLAALLAWLGLAPAASAGPWGPVPAPPAPGESSPPPASSSASPAGSAPAEGAPAVPAHEATPPAAPADGEVERHVALGHRLFALARYEEAVAEFRRAYEQRADPRFLYHIAESYRELGSKEQAVFYYDRYLVGAPKAPDRDEVEQKIAELGGVPGRAVRPRPRLLLEPTEEVQVKAQPTLWRRWWFWTAIGATLAAGVTAAVLVNRSNDGPPATELGSMRFF